MKQKKQLLLLAGILCLVLLFYLWIPSLNGRLEEKAAEAESYQVTEVSEDSISEISFTNDDASYAFAKNEEGWYYKQDTELVISQTQIEELLAAVCHIEAGTRIESVEAVSQYGLDEPLHRITVLTEGEELTIRIGAYNDITGEYYLCVDGEETVYLVSSSVVTPFSKTLETMTESS